MSAPKKGPNHKFFCLRKGEKRYEKFTEFYRAAPDVEIHDDLIRYINDTLLWVPCTHLSGLKKKMSYGLMLYGDTIIKQEGAEIFGHVIESWANLFSKAPSKFELTGGVMVQSDRRLTDPMEFYKIEIERDVVVENLRTLANYAKQAAAGDYFILHIGI
ncbi:MAG: Coagulation factor 5/8 type-like protein [Oscillatoria princeps RMCB-10]|nr:Coagulation factor 5/8 type-like protein [Oscillatoria princeps RMCB-10]